MDGDTCKQPGCSGSIAGGFCDRCGLEPPGQTMVLAPTAVQPRTPTASAVSAQTSGRSTSSSSRGSRRTTGSTRQSSRKHLGLGLVSVPQLAALDPEKVIMADPQVPEHKRFCANVNCVDDAGNPTALTRRQAGHCPQCGQRYSFVPSLTAGDVVAGQYEVKGCLAYGGFGWIYLAKDTVLNRWVVLKGLLNSADESAAAAAVAERQFLAAVKHANIVNIYNFVTHAAEGFIVMEYVGGKTLKELRKERGPLPPAEAIAYVHRILGAFAYLHQQGMVYCDFKPDNFMLEGDPPDVKLIDMGGVRRLDDEFGDIYGTRGYSAPEVREGPTVSTDLYTVGRSLAVLLLDFRFQSSFEYTLPTPAEQPCFSQHESLYRFLLRATAADPDQRFQSADEMAEQLGGVLREVVALSTGTAKPVESTLFGSDVLAAHEGAEWAGANLLPDLKMTADDPAANFLLATATIADPKRRVALWRERLKKTESRAIQLRLAADLIKCANFAEADEILDRAQEQDPFDWRVQWYRGASRLQQEQPKAARTEFEAVYAELPGELAAKLALAMAAELAGDAPRATELYSIVARTDPNFVTASFGLARCQARAGRRRDAVEAYRLVPQSSSLYARAQMSLARALVYGEHAPPSHDEIVTASRVIEELALKGEEQARLEADILGTTLELLLSKALKPNNKVVLLGQPLEEVKVRFGLERALRQLARLEPDRTRQIKLVDRANSVRPWTVT